MNEYISKFQFPMGMAKVAQRRNFVKDEIVSIPYGNGKRTEKEILETSKKRFNSLWEWQKRSISA